MSSCALMAGCIDADDLGNDASSEKDPIASGTLTAAVGDNVVQYMLKDKSGQYVSLKLDHIQQTPADGSDEPIDWRTASGSPVDVYGKKNADGSIDVDTMKQSTDAMESVSALVTTGSKRVLVFNVNFGSGTLGTDLDVKNVLTAAAKHLADSSFGKMKLLFDVRGDVNISFGQCGDEHRWMNEAKAAAQNAGVNLANYQHFEIFGKINCGYGGLGMQPGETTWIAGLRTSYVLHELGHNFGDFHAASRTCTGSNGGEVTMSDNCTFAEYGDPFDPMGHGGDHHYNANYKVNLGWIPAANVKVASGDKTYTLTPMTAPSTGLQLLRVQGPNDVMYQVEFRQPSPEDKFTATDPNVKGVLVHAFFTQAKDAGRAHLLDMSPDGNFNIAALQVGQSYKFFGTSTTITVASTAASGAQVRISGAASASALTTSGSLVAAHSNKCIGIASASLENGAKAVQWPCTGALDESWDFQDQGDSVFILKNQNSGKCLEVPKGVTTGGARLQQSDCTTSDAQKWAFVASSDTVALRSLASNKCVAVDAGSTADGVAIVQRECSGGANQEFHQR